MNVLNALFRFFFGETSPPSQRLKNEVSHAVPDEYATTVPLDNESRLARAKQERVTLESVFCEKKPKHPTENWKYRRMVKIYLVLGDERRKDIRRMLGVVGKFWLGNSHQGTTMRCSGAVRIVLSCSKNSSASPKSVLISTVVDKTKLR